MDGRGAIVTDLVPENGELPPTFELREAKSTNSKCRLAHIPNTSKILNTGLNGVTYEIHIQNVQCTATVT
jgi:hypothetical protein